MKQLPYEMTVKTNDFQVCLLESFRYCLGRKTYAVSDCVKRLQQHWQVIPPAWQAMIKKEIKSAIDSKQAGMDMDVIECQKILELQECKE